MAHKYAVMYFDTEFNLGISNKPNKWVNSKTDYYDNGEQALYDFITSDNITTQLISAENNKDLHKQCKQMIQNFKSKKWRERLFSPLP